MTGRVTIGGMRITLDLPDEIIRSADAEADRRRVSTAALLAELVSSVVTARYPEVGDDFCFNDAGFGPNPPLPERRIELNLFTEPAGILR